MTPLSAVGKVSGVYSIVCSETGTTYIGSSSNILLRWRNHLNELNRGAHRNQHLQRSWTKRGAESFSFSVVEVCPIDHLEVREQAHCDSIPKHLLFNLRPVSGSNRGIVYGQEVRANVSAGCKGRRLSAETRAKLSLLAKKRRASPETRDKMSRAAMGKIVTAETRAKIGAAHKGKVMSPEARAKISEARKNLSPEARANIGASSRGRIFTLESRAKMRASQLARWAKEKETSYEAMG